MRISLYRSYWKNRKENNRDCFACGWAEYKDETYDAERLATLLSEMQIDSVDAMKSLAFSIDRLFRRSYIYCFRPSPIVSDNLFYVG